MSNVLIVEDDVGLHKQYKWSISGHNLSFATTKSTALTKFNASFFDVVLLDLGLPPDEDNATEGLALLQSILIADPTAKVIVITGSMQDSHSREAISLGAFDYLPKGVDAEVIQHSITRASRIREFELEVANHKNEKIETHGLIGSSPKMNHTISMMEKVSKVPISTLITGESGTGKELFAQNIHDISGRLGSFVPINCASIPGELLESELFGHEKGAFTGAHKRKIGKVEQADGGTLFLDEIGDMPLSLQAKMLRFLQEKKIERVGSSGCISVDVRIVSATHRNIKEMINDGSFREDLFFRLAEMTLFIPPLRDRENDVIKIANFLLSKYKKDFNVSSSKFAKSFSDEALISMLNHDWPGNVRELQNCIKTAIVQCSSHEISSSDLGLKEVDIDAVVIKDLYQARKEVDIKLIKAAHVASFGNNTHSARLIGISRGNYYTLVKRYGLEGIIKTEDEEG